MKKKYASARLLEWILGFAGLLGVAASAAGAMVRSEFDTDTEGWLLVGDATTMVPSFVGSGGNPGGYAHGTDQTIGGVWYWQAPAKFLGDRSQSFGQTFSFDMRMRGSGPLFNSPDVTLVGGGLTLQVDLSPLPQDVAWTTYSVPLSDLGGWKIDTLGGAAATASQIQQVLGNLSALRIRGEFISGPDSGDLDTVVMAAVPEPQTYALLAAGVGVVAWAARRRAAHRGGASS